MSNKQVLLRSILCSFALASSGLSAMAQITLSLRNQTMREVIKEIEKVSDYRFFYNDDLPGLNTCISVDVKNGSIQNVLEQVSKQAPINYVLKDNSQIVLSFGNKPVIPQQKQVITGTIMDQNGIPVIGANVVEKGTTNGTVTDLDGNYSLEVSSLQATLQISYIGYNTLDVAIAGQPVLNASLTEDTQKLDEVVVVGYGTQSRAKVTSAISKLEGSKLVGNLAVTSFDQALASKLPGVNIQQATGAPGAGVNIKIRGTNSINYGGYPLIVVDGIPLSNNAFSSSMQGISTGYTVSPLSTINPSDIESIDVLKDAASAAIYGSRGSNGVLLITTKKGKVGKTKVGFNMYVGVSQVAKKVDVMDAYELANFTKEVRDLAWVQAGGNADDPLDIRGANYKYPDYMIPYINGVQGLTNTDWQDAIFRSAFQQNYDINVSGGSEKMNYYVSGNYTNQQGIILNSGMKRYSIRTNLNVDLTKNLKFGVYLTASQTANKLVQSEGSRNSEGLVMTALMYDPNLPVYNEDGSLATDLMINESAKGVNIATLQNPVALATMVKNNLTNNTFNGNAFLEYSIVDGLKLRTSFGLENIGMHRTYYRPKSLSHANEFAPTSTYNTGEDIRSYIYNWISETNMTYNKSWGEHNLDALLDFSAQKEHAEYTYAFGRNFPNDNVTTINAAATTTGSSFAQEATMISFLGRLMYSYSNRYMLSASLRRDGSSKFAENSKWGWFPSVSGGWTISREAFYPQDAFVNSLKLRASYGITGNAEIPYYGGTTVLEAQNYLFGGNVVLGFSPENAPNKDLSWESTSTVNVGVDAGFFDNKFQLTIDAYQSETRDLLLDVTVPATSGFTSALQNIGKVRNRGIEVMLSTSQAFGKDWKWDGSLVMSTNSNKVLALGPGQDQIIYSTSSYNDDYIVKVGESLGSFYGYKINGIFESQEQFDSTPHLENQNQGVGDFIYADTNNDGKVNEEDRVILGNANPKFTWGFNNTVRWRNFDLGLSFEGKHGQKVLNALHRSLAEGWGNVLSIYGTDKAPRPVWAYNTLSHRRPSEWMIEDASFVRIRNISLGYTFYNVIGIESMRIYASATNPFTFTKYSGYNPEVSNGGNSAITAGEDYGNYPVAKTYTIGLNVSF